ncbi:hypothetical protein EMPS_06901 [Entomortierella parvispora]|uniref:Protein kinase domain-containing protein n=1 Tax=Entomortierella parvispora TaxID=205924 RepID=A0A9P3LXX6_9FUNG|nr:hypothetical protein EMPS_06901 [Entomortierella parvispora]
MASIPSSAVSEAQDALASPPPLSKNDLFFSKPHSPSLARLSTTALGPSNDDAMVPSMASTASVAPSRKHTAWDDAFNNSTPTPRPPPRLAPMPRSPTTPSSTMPSTPTVRSPPPPIVIPVSTSAVVPSTTPVLAKGDLLDLSKTKGRYASSSSHARSFSYNQAHSHHGSNIFAHPVSTGADGGESMIATGGSPSLGSRSTMGAIVGGLAMGFNPDGIPVHPEEGIHATGEDDEDVDPSTPPSRDPHSILSHASPAAARPLPHNNRHSHQLPSSRSSQQPLHRNPLLTPSSSQSNLFSNLPSPLTRSTIGSSNIFRDPPSSSHSSLSSWVSPQHAEKVNGDDISESSVLNQDSNPGSTIAAVSSAPTSSGQRKIYPGLKNSVGPYKLLHNIGRGSFSEVKMAVDTRTGDHVAIKVMSRAMIQSSDRLGISVQRESELLKSIQHPNIIGFREVVETSLQMCIVLDYASGGELFEFVADKRAIASEADIQFIFAQIVDAVHYLHENNVVHRDLKLENVLLEPRAGAPLRPKVKLTDFGLAKVIEPDAPLLTTRCGSEDYAAPEIILGQAYDGREADIWSLGVVLYALLVGFLPFNMRPGMSRKSFLSMVAHAEFGFPGESVSIKRASLMDLHQRNGSTASLGSTHSTSAAEIFQQQQQHKAAAAAAAAASAPSPTTLAESSVPQTAAVPETSSTNPLSFSNLAASNAASAAEDIAHVMVVPKMRGVSAVSDESKDLVRWLLQTQGARRPMSSELFHHPWVVAGRQAVAAATAAEAGGR